MRAKMIGVKTSGVKLAWFAGVVSTTACMLYWVRPRRESRWDKAARTIRKAVTATQRELTPRLRAAAGAANYGAKEVTKAVAGGRKKLGVRGPAVQRQSARLLEHAPALMKGLCAIWTSGRQYARADRR
jgi:hypothetical protein